MVAVRVAFLGGMAAVALWLAAGAHAQSIEEPLTLPDSQLEPVAWSDIEGWTADDHLAAFAVFQTSCRPLLGAKRARDTRPV